MNEEAVVTRGAEAGSLEAALLDGLRAVGFAPEDCAPEALSEAIATHFQGRIDAEVERTRAEWGQKRTDMEQKLHAMERGVPAELAGQYVRLARAYLPDVAGFPEAMQAALADFPLARSQASAVAGTSGAAARKGWRDMTLAERSRIYRESPERARQLARESGEAL